VPRVIPRQPRFRPDQLVRAWQSFAYDEAQGVPRTVAKGTCMRGDADAVLRAPWCFVAAETPTSEEPSPLAYPPGAPPMFAGPTKLRVSERVSSVLYGPHSFMPGQEFTADARAAERLVEEGPAEVVE
jgi:hypothetical protein